ncbi:MAG: DUF302 domain-containing protein [Rubrivivax sp.]|nr:DUF302 domain-containing protein [Rubrivivax sp.]
MMNTIPLYRPSPWPRIVAAVIAAAAFAFAATIAFAQPAGAPAAPAAAAPAPGPDGVIRVRSAYGMQETIRRIREDIAAKGILFFSEVDQQQLAANAGMRIHPSTLLTFGNPPLGVQFLSANAVSGLDWPVRLLVLQDEQGTVWAAYTDFAWIARRHGITNRQEQFATATGVVASITSTVRAH